MTNFERIKSMSSEELAEHNVSYATREYTDWGFDGTDEYPYTAYEDGYKTSDGEFFWDLEGAIEHEIEWLQQEVEIDE